MGYWTCMNFRAVQLFGFEDEHSTHQKCINYMQYINKNFLAATSLPAHSNPFTCTGHGMAYLF